MWLYNTLRSPVCAQCSSLIPLNNPSPPLPIQDGQQVNTLRAADESLRLKAARKPVDLPEATACATTIGSVSDSSCPSSSMLERGPPITTPVADGSGSPFSSKMAAYRRVLPRRSGRRARLPCMICLGVQAHQATTVSSALSQVVWRQSLPPPRIACRLTDSRISLSSDDSSSIATRFGWG